MTLSITRVIADAKFGFFLTIFLSNMGWGVMSPVLGDLQLQFGIPIVQLALANSIYGVARLVFNMPIGLVMDRFDPRLIRAGGPAVWIAGLAICATAPEFNTFLTGRTISGIGAALTSVTNMVWVSRLSTDERRGRDLGIYQAVLQAGMSVSLVLGGVVAGWGGWRAAFWAAAVAALLSYVPMLVGGKEWVARVHPGTEQGGRKNSEVAEPRDRGATYSALFIANLVTFTMLFSASGFQDTVTPLYGSQVLSLNPTAIGVSSGVATILRFGTSLIGGELSDRYGRRVILIPGLIVVGIGALMLNGAVDLWTFWIAVTVISVGRFGNNVPATVLADHAPRRSWSFLLGLNRSVGDLAMVVGPVVMGLLLDHFDYGVTTFVIAAMAWVCALMVSVGVSETRPHQPVFGQLRAWLQTRASKSF